MPEAEKFPEFIDSEEKSQENLTSQEALNLSRKATNEAKKKARELIEHARALNLNEN